jgi:hypothetical protein
MKLIFAIIILQLFYLCSHAQQGMLLIQKNKRTVKAYYTGSNIIMQHKRGYTIQGILGRIQKDSFSVLNFSIKRVELGMGFARFDTSYNGYSFFSIADIKSIPILKTKSLIEVAEGLSYLGATGITIASIVNGVKFKENITTIGKEIAIRGGGLFLFGKLLSLFNKKNYVIQKKYSIALMQL